MDTLEYRRHFAAVRRHFTPEQLGLPEDTLDPAIHFALEHRGPNQKEIGLMLNALRECGVGEIKRIETPSDVFHTNITPLILWLRKHGQSASALAAALGKQPSQMSRFMKNGPIPRWQLDEFFREAKLMTASSVEHELIEVMEVIQSECQEIHYIPRGRVSEAQLYDLKPIKDLVIKHRYSINKLALAVGDTVSVKLGQELNGKRPITPDRLEKILNGAARLVSDNKPARMELRRIRRALEE